MGKTTKTITEDFLDYVREVVEMASSKNFTDRHGLADRGREILKKYAENRATPEEIEKARRLFDQGDEIEVDDDAMASRPGGDEGGVWVQGWLWCSDEEQ